MATLMLMTEDEKNDEALRKAMNRFFYLVRTRSGGDDNQACPCRLCAPDGELVSIHGPAMDFPDVISIISALRGGSSFLLPHIWPSSAMPLQ